MFCYIGLNSFPLCVIAAGLIIAWDISVDGKKANLTPKGKKIMKGLSFSAFFSVAVVGLIIAMIFR